MYMNEQEKHFYSIKEFAEKLRVHENTVRRSIKSGRIAAFRFTNDKNGAYRIPHSEIDRIVVQDLRKLFSNEKE